MCETSDVIVMVADSNEKSLHTMCDVLGTLGLEKIVCASNSHQGIQLSSNIRTAGNAINMLFCNANIGGLQIEDFIHFIKLQNKGLIVISYSKCVGPEAHIMSMFNTGSLDHIEQNQDFDELTSIVTKRWLRAAKLQHDYGQRYGIR